MSAITGIFHRDGRSASHSQIKKMTDVISHRGPDGSDLWFDGPVAMGHQMLLTTAESFHEKLPFEEDDLVITSDARIDNRKELSLELGIHDVEDVPDSYYILKAYQKWGDKCPERLLGDFAFVIWDKKKKILFCARDHMGIKPFYYYLSNDIFLFSTEIKSFFSIPEVPRSLNKLKLAFFLLPLLNDRTNTFYNKIFRLPAAHFMKISFKKHKKIQYWKLDPNLKIKLDSDEDYIRQFYDIYTEAIKCRLRSQKSVGFELSGGLDSSSIVCTTKKLVNNSNKSTILNTFSKIYNDISGADERYYIKKVVDTGGIYPNYLRADLISPLNNINEIFSYFDEPVEVPINSVSWNFNKQIQANNIRVILSGGGGDITLYKGYNYLSELTFTMHFKKLIKEIKSYAKNHEKKPSEIFVNRVILPFMVPFIPTFLKKIWRSYNNKRVFPDFSLMNESFIDESNLREYYKELHDIPSSIAHDSKKSHYWVINLGSHQYFLETANHRSAPFSVERRYPYYDKRLIEFCYAIPTEQKIKNGWDRMILRKTMKNILPKEVQWRTNKAFFNNFVKKNLLLFEKDKLDNIFYNDINLIKDYIDIKKYQDIYSEYKSNDNSAYILEIMRVVILVEWLKHEKLIQST